MNFEPTFNILAGAASIIGTAFTLVVFLMARSFKETLRRRIRLPSIHENLAGLNEKLINFFSENNRQETVTVRAQMHGVLTSLEKAYSKKERTEIATHLKLTGEESRNKIIKMSDRHFDAEFWKIYRTMAELISTLEHKVLEFGLE